MNKEIEPAPNMLIVLIMGLISISVFLFLDVKEAYALPAPVFGPLDHTYNLTIGNQSYAFRYGFTEANSVVERMAANTSSSSITVMVNDNSTTQEQRLFFIELPRNIINANSTEIDLGCSSSGNWVQNHDKPYKIAITSLPSGNTSISDEDGELCGRDTRTLSITYPAGKSMIVIQGTAMMPEFPLSLEVLVMTTGVAAVIGTSIAIRRRG